VSSTMQAITFSRYGDAGVLAPATIPAPAPGPRDVLVRVAAAGVNPADWRIRSGQFRRFMRVRLPFVPGTDLAGVVEAAGPQVSRVAPGDAVFGMLPSRVGGAYAELAVIAEEHLAHAPAKLPLGEAAALPMAGLTALQALRDRAELRPGAAILVYGASGGVGTMAVQIAARLGAEVTAATSARNAELVAGLGAGEVVDYQREPVEELGQRFDVVLDAVNAFPFGRSRRVLVPGGVAVTVNPIAGKLAPAWLAWTRGGRTLRSVEVQPSGADLRALAELGVRPVVERSLPLADAADAHRHSETGRTRGKLVLVVDERLAATSAPGTTAVPEASIAG